MRISTTQIFNIASRSMSDVNKEMIKTQEQMSTGKRVLTPADDPVASTKILALTDELASVKQYQKNIDIAQNNLSLEESLLDGVNTVIQRIQELAVRAGNTGTLSRNEYVGMAAEVEERLDELMNLMNSQNASGDYIFGGYNSANAPFSGDSFSGFNYAGDGGQQKIKVSDSTSIRTTDSGKTLFMDIQSANNTVQTSASVSNKSNPPASINIGLVVDQDAYDEFYPEDMVIAFNADSAVNPPGKNFTVSERSTGRVIAQNVAFSAGSDVQINGVSFRISGSPSSGTAAVPATRIFGVDSVLDFSAANFAGAAQTFTVRVGNHTETLVLDANLTNVNDLSATLNSGVNGNAQKLARLGISVDNQGFHMPQGVNFQIQNGTPAIDAVMGFDTTAGTASVDGARAKAGDQFFVDSTEKQGLLATVARFKDAMATFDGSEDAKDMMAEIVGSTLNNLSNAQTSISDVVSQIGARMNTLESTRDLHLDTELVTNEILSELRDVDYAEAATRLSAQTLILQAAQQSFIRVSQLNLFARL